MGKHGSARIRRADGTGLRRVRSAWWLTAAFCGLTAACAPPTQAINDSLGEIDDSFDDTGNASGDDDAGVGQGTDGAKPPRSLLPPAYLSNEAIVELVRNFSYRGPGFKRANGKLFPSTVAPGKLIDMWVSEEAAEQMGRVAPERSGTRAEIPTGTVIVREVYDGTTLTTITVMVKMLKGSFPLGGDFWYTVTDPDGTVRRNEAGDPLAGLLENCGTCHLRRSDDAFLFGTPIGYEP